MREKLMEIGKELASIYGGECTGFFIDKENKEVCFDYLENGEEGCTFKSFKDLEKEHNIKEKDMINFNKKNKGQER